MKKHLVGLTVAITLAGPAFAADQTLIHDLGTAHPNAKNLSQDPAAAVYRWDHRGGDFTYQINGADGQVLSVFMLARDGNLQQLPIGRLQRQGGGAEGGRVALNSTDSGGQCPCRTVKNYEDAYVISYVVLDRQNKAIYVYAVPKVKTQIQ